MRGNQDRSPARAVRAIHPLKVFCEGLVIVGLIVVLPIHADRLAGVGLGMAMQLGSLIPTQELIILSPLILLGMAVFLRCRILRRPLFPAEKLIYGIAMIGAALLPLRVGVWIPDLFGIPNTLAKVKTPTGHEISVVQRWSFQDFYTTKLRVRLPNGTVIDRTIDGDDLKRWNAAIQLNDPHSATITLRGHLPYALEYLMLDQENGDATGYLQIPSLQAGLLSP